MRTLAVTQNITLDGSIEMIGDWFNPQGQASEDNSDLIAELAADSADCDALVLGRQTFEDMRGYWPHVENDATGVTNELNELHKYVVSSTMTDPEWQNSSIITGNVIDEVAKLKEQSGKEIVVTGSIQLVHALFAANLVDQVRLFTYPVVQGRGRRLFPDGYEVPKLNLLYAKSFRSGITYSRYSIAR